MNKALLIVVLALLFMQPIQSMDYSQIKAPAFIALSTGAVTIGIVALSYLQKISIQKGPTRLWTTLYNMLLSQKTEQPGSPMPSVNHRLSIGPSPCDCERAAQDPKALVTTSQEQKTIFNADDLISLAQYDDKTSMPISQTIYKALVNLCKELQQSKSSIELRICGRGLTELPDQLGDLKIEKLNLQGNWLTQQALNTLCRLPDLRELNLSFNNLTQLPQEIKQLKQLQKLILYYNRIMAGTIANLCESLTNLQELNLGRNNLAQLPDKINNLTRLQLLDLSDNELSLTAQYHIRQLLPHTKIDF